VVWGNLPAHKSGASMPGIRSHRSWLVAEHLPSYTPDLNPVETLGATSSAKSSLTSPAMIWAR
jgi:transposase